MGLFSKLKDISASVGVLSKLCDKTWDMIDSDDRTTLIFKKDNKLHYILNGESSIVPYDFFPDSNTLIAYFFNNVGLSLRIKFVNSHALIIYNEAAGEEICFGNRNSKDCPLDKLDAYKHFFSKQVKYMLYERESYYDGHRSKLECIANVVDDATEGLDGEDIINCINVFRREVYHFDTDYVLYLALYKEKNDPHFDKSKVDSVILKKMRGLYSSFQDSKTLNNYIIATGDSIYKHRIVLKKGSLEESVYGDPWSKLTQEFTFASSSSSDKTKKRIH